MVCEYVVGQYVPNGASNLFQKFLVARMSECCEHVAQYSDE